jgi:hypothetical protein
MFEAAVRQKPVGARGLSQLLDSLEDWLRDLALAAAGGMEKVSGRDQMEFYRDLLERAPFHPIAVAAAAREVANARVLASGNINPQLIIFGLLQAIRRELIGPDRTAGTGR